MALVIMMMMMMIIIIIITITTYVILQLMYLLKDAQCNQNVSSFFAIYYYFDCLRSILDCTTAGTVSVDCQSSHFC